MPAPSSPLWWTRRTRTPSSLTNRGRTAAVLISPAAYEHMLEALEDREDIAAYDAAMNEEGPNIPWDEVKADLGLD